MILNSIPAKKVSKWVRVDICSITDLHGLQDDNLLHHGLFCGLLLNEDYKLQPHYKFSNEAS